MDADPTFDERTLGELIDSRQPYVHHASFHRRDAESLLFDQAPIVPAADTSWYAGVVHEADASQANKHRQQLILTGTQEVVLFLQMNYARFRVRLAQERPRRGFLLELLGWHRASLRLRRHIAEVNLGLVLSMVRQFERRQFGRDCLETGELVAEGNAALLRAVDKYDAGRGFKFSTYACRAIHKACVRAGMKHTAHLQRFGSDLDEARDHGDGEEDDSGDVAAIVRKLVLGRLGDLDGRQRRVLALRFGIGRGAPNRMSLAATAKVMGVSKVEVSALEAEAMRAVRGHLDRR